MTIDDMPERLLNALHERGHTDEQITLMSGRRAFNEFCRWHGFSDWGPIFWELAIVCGIKGKGDQ